MNYLMPFLFTFALVFPAELGDKTEIVILTLSAVHGWRLILGGALLGFSAAQVPAAVIGVYLGERLSGPYLAIGAGTLLILMGIYFWFTRNKEEKDEAEKSPRWGKWGKLLGVAFLIFLMECGDKTQIIALTAAARYQTFWPVLAGALSALMLASGLALLVGRTLLARINKRILNEGAAILFVLMGILTIGGFF